MYELIQKLKNGHFLGIPSYSYTIKYRSFFSKSALNWTFEIDRDQVEELEEIFECIIFLVFKAQF